ncbi:MAG: aspartate-semialdehyde dehydrogenase [Thermodesulfobacteriota bacterium]
MKKVAFVGYRGMVGSVLMERMKAEKDFSGFSPYFASTSQAGAKAPGIGAGSHEDVPPVADAHNIDFLSGMDIIVTCQGSGYTQKVFPALKKTGWNGYWIDASSALRMEKDSIIVLDPVNRNVIDKAIHSGVKNFIGGNCTVSLMLMAIGELFRKGCIEWMTSMTYQAASGAGAKNMRELVAQMKMIGQKADRFLSDPDASILDLDANVIETMTAADFATDNFGAPLAGSLLPWIDAAMADGRTKEEWKGFAETNKILENDTPVPIDGICVRIGAMRCHSQAMTIKLTKDIPVEEITQMISGANEWVRVIPNTKEETVKELSPAAVTGKLTIPVGRIRKLAMGGQYLGLFTVGDQLLWGAAEPVRRMLNILLGRL